MDIAEENTNQTVLELSGLSKNYGTQTAAEKISLTIRKGTVWGLLGPNGSGKSTTLKMILGLARPSGGSFRWFGGEKLHKALLKVGSTIEKPNIMESFTAFQHLKMTAIARGIPEGSIRPVLQRVGLEERRRSKAGTFSTGMKQRLSLASAFIGSPEVLILDEPTNGLDAEGIHEVRELIRQEARKGTTVLLASHMLDEVEKVCDHVLVLQQGKTIAKGPVSELLKPQPVVEVAGEDLPGMKAFLSESDLVAAVDEKTEYFVVHLREGIRPQELNRELSANGMLPTHFVQRKTTLESAFLSLTQNKQHEKGNTN